ncbi:MAG TPA: EVE domain-containing protein [Betaproteobacteria bacterium]|jgi:predicted RNA-binding protein with PUA-like domain|nr:EVE domain-containing protein [Burkholderiales bacterium]HBZ19149.1 EVE domain-containing protein [Betaproteobacteria bacterium]
MTKSSHTQYWLMKSEPNVFSIDDLQQCPRKTDPWNGVRNYQARNFMKDDMALGDGVLFYHSNCSPPGIAGYAEVAREAYPDASQFDKVSDYFDPKATKEKPRWFNVDIKFVRKTALLSLQDLREHPQLESMKVLQKGSRLSITPVTSQEWRYIQTLI